LRQDIGTRVTHAVDAMSESHETLAPIELGADDRFRALGSADFEDHVQRGTRRPAVQRTLERADRAGDRRNDVRSRGDDHPCRKRGSVEAVIADGVEIRFQRAGPFGRWFGAEHLLQVMSRVRQIGAHRNGRFPIPHPPVGPHDRREARDGGQRVVQGVLLAAEAEQGRRHPQDVHGGRLGGGGGKQDVKSRAGQRAPPGQILREASELGRVRQAGMQQQESHFLEPGVRR